jgi:microcystin-dependent protein
MQSDKAKKQSYKIGKLYLNDGSHELSNDNFFEVKPSYTGDLKYSVQGSDHNGWVKCDGRSLNREHYPKLFDTIGTSFGSNDSASFNLPDCRGRVLGIIGQGSDLTNRNIGTAVGAETHTLTTTEIPSHSHTGTTNSAGNHTHTTNANGGTLGLVTSDGNNTASGDLDTTTGEPNLYTSPTALSINSAGDHTHTFTTSSVGGGGAHNIMQPTLFISNVFIYSM